MVRADIEDLLMHGLAADTFRAERAYFLLKEIGEHAGIVNSLEAGNYGELFGALQVALQSEAVLAISRMYDPPSQRYPTRCIHGLLNYIEKRAAELPDVANSIVLADHMRRHGVPAALVEKVALGGMALAHGITLHYRLVLATPEVVVHLAELKALRDKELAHNECATYNNPTWKGLLFLIAIAQEIAGTIGWAYLNTALSLNGKYTLSDDAMRPSIAMRRLARSIERIATITAPN